MPDLLLYILLILALAAIALLIVLLLRPARINALPDPRIDALAARLDTLSALNDRTEKAVRDEAGASRSAAEQSAAALRNEVRDTVNDLAAALRGNITAIGKSQGDGLTAFTEQVAQRLNDFSERVNTLSTTQTAAATGLKTDLSDQLGVFGKASTTSSLALSDAIGKRLDEFATRITALAQQHETAQKNLRDAVESRLNALRADNEQKLEQMRKTVDEKLHDTLEKRLGESFKLVSDRLEQVHRGLGEMQSLSSNVTDLTRIMSNVKSRGIQGEWMLKNLLEQMLAPDQYRLNFAPNPQTRESVEFAVRMPGKSDDASGECWLPIDSKFPIEAYHRLVAAAEAADLDAVALAGKEIESAVRACAKDISAKYLNPPTTTNFAVLFLPVEGLFAEVLRRPGILEDLQRQYRVTITGPTTLAAYLSSLQMGFQTLAIQRRSSEVWQILGAVKTEFEKFGDMLDKVDKKLDEAKRSVETATGKTRTINRKLRDVQALPAAAAEPLLPASPNLLDTDTDG